jgi:GNAT superfamily N-acetyltransferase
LGGGEVDAKAVGDTVTSRGGIRVRAATAADRAFVLGLVPRLRSSAPPAPWRTDEQLDGAEGRVLAAAFDELPPGAVLLVAEDASDGPLGMAYAERATDYFSGEEHGHLAILAVSAAAQGRGVGRALLGAVEEWAAGEGYRLLTLNVFAANDRARAIYEHAGFTPDTVRYAKLLDASPPRE